MRFLEKIKTNQLLSVLVFVNGAVIMSIEMIGAKTIAPYFGSSIYVWTAVIGVILASLSLGYWKGGVIADKSASIAGLSKIFLLSASILAVTILLQKPILDFIDQSIPSLRLQAGLASLFLFAPSTYFLGMVSPYSAKLALTKLKQTGEVIGKLYALGTFGSIFGTFLTGYYLINYVGLKELYWIFTGCLIVLSIVCKFYAGNKITIKSIVVFLFIGSLIVSVSYQKTETRYLLKKDTAYATYEVVDTIYKGEKTRLLITDSQSAQSGVILNDPYNPPFDYAEAIINVVKQQKPSTVLMIGGGTYTIPTIITKNLPDTRIDIVEIDEELTDIAKNYFFFNDAANIKIFHEDGRTFINNSQTDYDLVVVDAFSSIRPPVHLTTTESIQQIERVLKDDGVMVSNIIGSTKGERAQFVSSVMLTMQSVFEHVEIYHVSQYDDKQIQNLLFIASNSRNSLNSLGNKLKPATHNNSGRVLTDNFAPIDKMLGDF